MADSSLRGRAKKADAPRTASGFDPAFDSLNLDTNNSPWLPSPAEQAALLLFPAILVFGALYALLSPTVRSAPYDPHLQAHVQDPALAPSYFARKSNLFNILFVKRGWAWVTGAFVAFVATHPTFLADNSKSSAPSGGERSAFGGWLVRLRAVLRWAMVTTWWFVVTQWCFGPALIDRGFRWTGGRCEMALDSFRTDPVPGLETAVSALACKTLGGRWSGGHDISGHVFLLVLGIGFLAQEVGWAVGVWAERAVVQADGTVVRRVAGRGASRTQAGLGVGGKAVLVVLGLSVWMLLMTAIYFHTWVEKFTGLLTALVGLYAVYIVPRFVPVLRGVVGLPGV